MSAMKVPYNSKDAKAQHPHVFVRVRPFSEQELQHRSQNVVSVKGPRELVVNGHTTPKIAKTYTFDGVFGPDVKQLEIYQRVVGQTVFDVLAGFNCTVFAYGQTGSGKTYTMEGNISEGDQGAQAGIIPRVMSALFDELRLQMCEFTIRISFIEIYNEELYDLFSPDEVPSKLRLFDDPAKKGSVIIPCLEEILVHSKGQVLEMLRKGLAKRQVAATQMNALSSRSHTVFCATVHTKENNLEGEELVKYGKLYLVDLAGSENIGRSGAVDKRAREAGSINQSLLTLGRVISCLVERQPHVPYRESKLTRILQDSLGGRTKTTIIATVSPSASNVEETVSVLDYALKAKCVSNKPEVNQKVSKESVIKEYAVLIEDLKKKLDLTREGTGFYIATENYQSIVEQLEGRNKDLAEKIAEIRVCANEIKKCERLFEDATTQLSSKEKQRAEVKRTLGETTEFVEKSKVELEKEREKLAEATELVEKSDHYENHVQGQAKNLISIVEECQGDNVRLHSKVDNGRSILQHNCEYASTLCEEAQRIIQSFFRKMTEFHEAYIALDTFCEYLRLYSPTRKQRLKIILDFLIRVTPSWLQITKEVELFLERFQDTLKDENNQEIKSLKNHTYIARDQFVSTLDKVRAVIEDQATYNAECNRETLEEVKKLREEQSEQLTRLENEMKSMLKSFNDLTKEIALMKSPVSDTALEVKIAWLSIIDEMSKKVEKKLKEAANGYIHRVNQSVEVLEKIDSATKDHCLQQEKFNKERSKADDEILKATAKLENLLSNQDSESETGITNTENLVRSASDFCRTSEHVVTNIIAAAREDALYTVNDLSYSAPNMTNAISKHTEKLQPRIEIQKSAVQNFVVNCEKVLTDNKSAWATLVTDMEDGLKAREKESKHTLQIEDSFLEEMQKSMNHLCQKQAEDAGKFYDKFEKFQEESDRTFNRLIDVSANIRSDLEDHLKSQSTLVRTFVYDQFKRDCPTGETPPRKNIQIPPLEEPLASPDVRRIIRKVDDDLDYHVHLC